MNIDELLQATIQFILTNPSGTETEYITYMVGLGETQEHIAEVLGIYIGLLVKKGFITDETFDGLRVWATSITQEQLLSAVALVKADYLNSSEYKASVVQAQIIEMDNQITAQEAKLPKIDDYIASETDEVLLEMADIAKTQIENSIKAIKRSKELLNG